MDLMYGLMWWHKKTHKKPLKKKSVIVGAYVTEKCSLASQKCQKIASIKRELCVLCTEYIKTTNPSVACCRSQFHSEKKKKLSAGCTQRDTEMVIIAAYSSLLVHVKAISLL